LREVAHLLRSPIGSIVMLADALKTDGVEVVSAAQRHKLDIIHRAALGVATTAGDILSLVSDEEAFARVPTLRVDETLASVAEVVRPVAESRKTRLDVEARVEGVRTGPASALLRALLGLTLRAALHVRGGHLLVVAESAGGEEVRFDISAKGDERAAVEDPHELLKIFHIDRDSGTYTLSQEGLGLTAGGVLVARMGSSVDLRTEPDGTIRLGFSLVLPPTEG
jgi:signal transduction histidine kinase